MDLIDDGVDLALRITNTPSPGLYGKPLMPVTHVICATPEYLRRAGTPQHPHDLRSHSCISLGETPADSRWKFTLQGKRRSYRRTDVTRLTTRACGWMRSNVMSALGVYRCLRHVRLWKRGKLCRCCHSGSLSAAIRVSSGCFGRVTNICPPECGQ